MQARAYQTTFFFPVAAAGMWLLAAEEKDPGDPAGPQPRVAIEPRAAKPVPGAEAPATDRRSNIRVDSTLVQINVTVTTPLGQVVTGMEKEHFKIFEDKVQQNIASFTSEEAPLSVGLVFDISGSMNNKLAKSRQAAKEFFKSANPQDEFFLVQFNERPELVMPWTHSTEEIINRLAFTQAKGRTALLDGLYLAMNEMKKATISRTGRRYWCCLMEATTPADIQSQKSRTLCAKQTSKCMRWEFIEAIGGRGRSPEEMSGPGMLTELAEQTGGRHFPIDNISELPDVAAKIGVELRSQYMIGYTPQNLNKDGKYRRVEVKLAQPRGLPPLRAYYRTGYYAPTQ